MNKEPSLLFGFPFQLNIIYGFPETACFGYMMNKQQLDALNNLTHCRVVWRQAVFSKVPGTEEDGGDALINTCSHLMEKALFDVLVQTRRVVVKNKPRKHFQLFGELAKLFGELDELVRHMNYSFDQFGIHCEDIDLTVVLNDLKLAIDIGCLGANGAKFLHDCLRKFLPDSNVTIIKDGKVKVLYGYRAYTSQANPDKVVSLKTDDGTVILQAYPEETITHRSRSASETIEIYVDLNRKHVYACPRSSDKPIFKWDRQLNASVSKKYLSELADSFCISGQFLCPIRWILGPSNGRWCNVDESSHLKKLKNGGNNMVAVQQDGTLTHYFGKKGKETSVLLKWKMAKRKEDIIGYIRYLSNNFTDATQGQLASPVDWVAYRMK